MAESVPEKLVKELGNLSGSVAHAYRSVAIDGTDTAEKIFKAVYRDQVITAKEAEALRLIVTTTEALEVSDLKILVELLIENWEPLTEGLRKRVSEKRLDHYKAVLQSTGVSKINFFSPGTHHIYEPNQYHVICSLIMSKKIKIYEIDDQGFSTGLAAYAQSNGIESGGLDRPRYNPETNEMTMYMSAANPQSPVYFDRNIVHELTHAIQDWGYKNQRGLCMEVDARVAEAVFTIEGGLSVNKGMESTTIGLAMKAAEFVLKREATQNNEDWRLAYQAIVDKLLADPTYAQYVNSKKQVSDPAEYKKFHELWNDLLKKSGRK